MRPAGTVLFGKAVTVECRPTRASTKWQVWPTIASILSGGTTLKEVIATDRGPSAIGPYSQAIRANGFLFVSGQIALDPSTQLLIVGDIKAQTERVMENLKGIVEAAGSALDRVVRTTVFLADMNEFAPMNEIYARYFPGQPPARSTVQVARLPRDVRVEIDLIALA
jgi:2-iminobutanoate/2-iminopropanoate deaminase